MITCQVGKKKIDTFSYEPKQLREWSNRGLLKCPICGAKMIYNHGEFKIPHFKHEKNYDCPDIYSEGITEEHIKGIELLYSWLQQQEGVTNIELEKWIPDTKQRPDIYFEYGGEPYVIEFQCSPIATKFLERRELYGLNEINDIWILGCEKYDINNFIDDISLSKEYYKAKRYATKTIEKEIYDSERKILYLDTINKNICKVGEYDIELISNVTNSYTISYLKSNFSLNISKRNINNITLANIIDYKSLSDSLINNNQKYIDLIGYIDNSIQQIRKLSNEEYYRIDYGIYKEPVINLQYERGYWTNLIKIDSINKIDEILYELESKKNYKEIRQNQHYLNIMRHFNDIETKYNAKCYIDNQKEDRKIVHFATRWCEFLLDKEWKFNIDNVDQEMKQIYEELYDGIDVNRIIKIRKIIEHYQDWVYDKGENYFNIKFKRDNKTLIIGFGFNDIKIIEIKNSKLYFESKKYNYTHKKLKEIISNTIREMRYGGSTYEETKTV